MGNLNQFFRDLGRNAYGLGENVASLGSAAIAEPVAGFAAMYDPANGAQAIREGMTYQPRTQAGQMYQQGAARTLGTIAKPAMPVIDTWQRGVDIAGGYSPAAGAMLRTVPAAIGVAMGAKPALQAGRQVSNSLGAMQARMIANANAPRILNTGYMGQRGAIGTLSTDDDLRALARFNQMDDVYKFDNSHEYYDTIDKLVARNLSDDSFDFMELPTSYGKMSITPSAKEQGKWQVTQWAKDGNPLSDSGNLTKEKALRVFFEDSRPELLSPPKRPLTEFEQAHLTAQRNAALPVNQGGLGLPADNTAMDRARAMGFDVEAYHTSRHGIDVDSLDSGKYAIAPFDAIGTHFGTKEAALDRFNRTVGTTEQFKGSTYPVLLKGSNPLLSKNGQVFNEEPLMMSLSEKADYGNLSKSNALQREQIFSQNSIIPYINDVEMPGSTSYIAPPSSIRSRFAAFDPFNRESSNLLAQSAKFAPAATLGALMANEKRKDKRN